MPSAWDKPNAGSVRKKGRWKLAAVVAAILVFLAIGAFFGVGRWLVVEDSLQPAQSIVVLSGRMPVRAMEAAKLYRGGYAPEIWLTRSEQPGAALKAMDITYVGEEFYNLRVLVHEGVPPEAIRVLSTPIVNTVDEVEAIGAEMRPEGNKPVIIVTSKTHTRRVRALWRKLAGSQGRAIVRGASGDSFDPAHWWRNTRDALDVAREILGLLNAWTGLLMRPAPGS